MMTLLQDLHYALRSFRTGRSGLVLSAIVLGLVSALATTHLLESLLYGLTATDPRVLGAVATLLAGAAVLAAYPPARRAARVDPMAVIRNE